MDAKSILKGLMGFSVVPIVTSIITIFIIPIISNVFPTGEYGKINLFYSTGTLLVTLFMLGTDNSFIRYYFEPPKGLSRGSLQLIALLVGLTVTILTTVIALCFASESVSSYLFGEYRPFLILVLGIYVAALILFRILNTDARMRENYQRYNIQSIAQVFITRIAFVFVAVFSTHYTYSILAMTVGMLLLSLFFLILQRKTFSLPAGKVPRSSIKKLFSFGLPVMATNFVLNLNGMVGKFLLGGAGMYKAVGVFAIATTLSNVFTVIPTAFSTYWSPFMYKNYKTEQETIIKVHDFIMLASGVIVALIIVFQDVLFTVVGGEYAACQAYFMVIMLNPIQALICETTAYGIVLKEKPKYNVAASFAGVVASITTTAVLMDSMGIYAAALGVAVSSVVVGALRTIIGQHYYKSIDSGCRTLVCVSLIVAACFGNSIFCRSIATEILAGVVLLALVLIIYIKQIKNITYLIKETKSHRHFE